uniref:Polyadenylate-binding protein 2 n=1 Tax=Kalanchoe fedtschenkoi TaxID=63787 RepID=A0A7N0VMJ1_KALFE
MEEEEHEVYGGDIPDLGEDADPHNGDVNMPVVDDNAVKELDEMKERLKEMEEEAAALREMQAMVEMGDTSNPAGAAASHAGRERLIQDQSLLEMLIMRALPRRCSSNSRPVAQSTESPSSQTSSASLRVSPMWNFLRLKPFGWRPST